jgi:hypothetical protein
MDTLFHKGATYCRSRFSSLAIFLKQAVLVRTDEILHDVFAVPIALRVLLIYGK